MKFRRERKRPEGFLWRCFQGDPFTTRKMTRNLYGHPACCTGAVIVRTCPFRSVSFVLPRPRHSLATMNRVLPLEPPSMQAKQPSSRLIVCRTCHPLELCCNIYSERPHTKPRPLRQCRCHQVRHRRDRPTPGDSIDYRRQRYQMQSTSFRMTQQQSKPSCLASPPCHWETQCRPPLYEQIHRRLPTQSFRAQISHQPSS